MDGTLSLVTRTLGFSDANNVGNDPQKRNVDWRSSLSVSAKNIASVPYTIAPGASLTLFDGTRTIAADDTTEWELTLSPLSGNRYRFTWDGTGTAPQLRNDRQANVTAVTVTVNANQTATFTATAGNFGFAADGDTLFIPGQVTGDGASVFNPLNQGQWVILSHSGSTVLNVARLPGTQFQAFGEAVTPASASAMLVYSAAGVQIGDGVSVNAGFSLAVQRGYTVEQVTPTWFEVTSTASLPVDATAVPLTNGIQFFSAAKRYVELWGDQEAVVRFNGATDDTNKISPWQAGDVTQMGLHAHAGLSWSAVVVNKSTSPLNLTAITAE